jgi:thymidylate synthase
MPCHITAQFNVRENGPSRRMSLDCCVYMRSSDVMLGLPYDIVLYAVLQSLIADHCGYKACKLTFFFGNAHIYKNHVVEARKLLLTGPQLCSVELLLNKLESVTDFMPIDATILRYNPAPAVHFPLNL